MRLIAEAALDRKQCDRIYKTKGMGQFRYSLKKCSPKFER
jgi:hypothetical protein